MLVWAFFLALLVVTRFVPLPELLEAAGGFSRLFLSILLEAFPFIVIGSFVSSVIHLYVHEGLLRRFVPRSPVAASLVAGLLGFVFPLCECAIIPVTRALIRKGLPVPAAVTFQLAAPIVNPVVIASTAFAFAGLEVFIWLRVAVGYGLAVVCGLIIGALAPRDLTRPARNDGVPAHAPATASSPEAGEPTGPGEPHGLGEPADPSKRESHEHFHGNVAIAAAARGTEPGVTRVGRSALLLIRHAAGELYDISRFLILGAALAAAVQLLVPASALLLVARHPVVSVLVLMALAYGLSLCSEADAFIARSFAPLFAPGAVVSFMTFGPMLDVKNTAILYSRFPRRYVALFMATTAVANLVVGVALNLAMGGSSGGMG